ncbi:transcription factor 24-like [Tetranychus urticae]|uniref:BHLH domain-containing protein n=1 Tax=Tetranychus urticae TaxID=32264 RepID=T1KSP8_TETUR|nr:transcription factor 24-like [Tetranychus urticae]
MNSTRSRLNRSSRSSSSSSSSTEIGKNAARERSRVRSLRLAFHRLQNSIPKIPPDTKLSKLDVLLLATDYIASLTKQLSESEPLTETDIIEAKEPVDEKILHPIKKWPMRSRLYASADINSSYDSSSAVARVDSLDFPDSSCFLLDKIEPINTDEWDAVDFNIFYDDLSSLSSFPNLQ